MPRGIAAALSAAALTAAAVLSAPARPAAGEASPLAVALRQPALAGAKVAVQVVGAADGRVLFARDPDAPLKPASNLKILTAAAALSAFGPAHRFETVLSSDAAPDVRGAVGTLYVRGGGDPALTSEEWWRLAADLRLRGLREVRGDVVLDASAFDDVAWNPAWGARSARAFHASVSALTANYGAFTVAVRPGAAAGRAAQVSIDPAIDYLVPDGSVRTVSGKASLTVDRRPGGGHETVVTAGSVRAGTAVQTVHRSVADPTLYAGAVLRAQLAANGIRTLGRTRLGAAPAGAHELLAYAGKPLAEIVRLLMKYSNNNIAEMLLKSLGALSTGAPGSWETGVAAVESRVRGLGIDLSGCRIVDGSGLAAANRVTARALVGALRAARGSFQIGPELVASLPIAGRDGTLEQRAAGALDAMRAKTGLLAGATALSGYARLRDGGEVVFSILVNDYRSGDREAMDAVDAIAAALVESRVSSFQSREGRH